MPQGIGAGGFVGIAVETVSGTYTAPTLYVPIDSETLAYTQATSWRRPIRQSADIINAVPGNAQVGGDISIEAREDAVAMLLLGARVTMSQSGTTPNFVQTFIGNANAVATRTLSVTVVRDG